MDLNKLEKKEIQTSIIHKKSVMQVTMVTAAHTKLQHIVSKFSMFFFFLAFPESSD